MKVDPLVATTPVDCSPISDNLVKSDLTLTVRDNGK
jgi:hypothetical protein